jgi:hypothetical protein
VPARPSGKELVSRTMGRKMKKQGRNINNFYILVLSIIGILIFVLERIKHKLFYIAF